MLRRLDTEWQLPENVSLQEAIPILDCIAAGLEEIGDIIHRDLKPDNVLLHDGLWKLADLGLARFAEASTSLNTMRESGTSTYAAPEQWRGERPQKATEAPSDARRSTIARPIPRVPPVTRAILPARNLSMG